MSPSHTASRLRPRTHGRDPPLSRPQGEVRRNHRPAHPTPGTALSPAGSGRRPGRRLVVHEPDQEDAVTHDHTVALPTPDWLRRKAPPRRPAGPTEARHDHAQPAVAERAVARICDGREHQRHSRSRQTRRLQTAPPLRAWGASNTSGNSLSRNRPGDRYAAESEMLPAMAWAPSSYSRTLFDVEGASAPPGPRPASRRSPSSAGLPGTAESTTSSIPASAGSANFSWCSSSSPTSGCRHPCVRVDTDGSGRHYVKVRDGPVSHPLVKAVTGRVGKVGEEQHVLGTGSPRRLGNGCRDGGSEAPSTVLRWDVDRSQASHAVHDRGHGRHGHRFGRDSPQSPAVPLDPLVDEAVEIDAQCAGFRDEAGAPVMEKSPVACGCRPW